MRKERICHQCPGKPPMNQCVHTNIGKKYLQMAVQSQSPENSPAIPATQTLTNIPALSMPRGGPESSDGNFNLDFMTTFGPNDSANAQQTIDPILLQQGPPAGTRESSGLLRMPPSADVGDGPESAGDDPFDNINKEIDEEMDDPDPDTDQTISPKKAPRNRVTKANPKHGLLYGAYRGGEPWVFPYPRPLRAPIKDSREASARFARKMGDIIVMCAILGIETGSWIHVAGQHPNARGQFIHYASPRLLDEAFDATNDIVNIYGDMFASLLAAKKNDAFKLNMDLEAVRRKKEEQEKLNAKLLEEARKKDEDLEAVRAQLDALKRQMQAYGV